MSFTDQSSLTAEFDRLREQLREVEAHNFRLRTELTAERSARDSAEKLIDGCVTAMGIWAKEFGRSEGK